MASASCSGDRRTARERTASRVCHGQDRCHGDRADPAIAGFVRRMNNASALASRRPIVERKVKSPGRTASVLSDYIVHLCECTSIHDATSTHVHKLACPIKEERKLRVCRDEKRKRREEKKRRKRDRERWERASHRHKLLYAETRSAR